MAVINTIKFPFKPACTFAANHGQAKEVQRIKQIKIDWKLTYTTTVHRGYIIRLLHLKGLLPQFFSEVWPRGLTKAGRSECRRCIRVARQFDATLKTPNRVLSEAAGWRFGDAADFLEISNEERQLLDARVAAALAVRRQREALKLTQKQLAVRIKTSQPRVVKIERAAADVSLDQILKAFAAAGGKIRMRNSGSPKAKAVGIEFIAASRTTS